MKTPYLSAAWKSLLIIGFILACIDFASVMVYHRNYFPNLSLMMMVIILAAGIIRYYSEK